MFLFWALIGALIGLAAAQKKGFSIAGGIIGGILLGPLAFLMFFISGVSSADANRRKCPSCAEWVKGEAKVCKHCGKDLPLRNTGVEGYITRSGKCVKCGAAAASGSRSCAACGATLTKDARTAATA